MRMRSASPRSSGLWMSARPSWPRRFHRDREVADLQIRSCAQQGLRAEWFQTSALPSHDGMFSFCARQAPVQAEVLVAEALGCRDRGGYRSRPPFSACAFALSEEYARLKATSSPMAHPTRHGHTSDFWPIQPEIASATNLIILSRDRSIRRRVSGEQSSLQTCQRPCPDPSMRAASCARYIRTDRFIKKRLGLKRGDDPARVSRCSEHARPEVDDLRPSGSLCRR